ncbi:hypothetical protein [Paraburkholderia phenoliruptrix]|uniref:hypothetical protein n=1 Tax=Paraburkholderia phenoliruptrix TaxID=252970 RepID=UPI003D9645B7
MQGELHERRPHRREQRLGPLLFNARRQRRGQCLLMLDPARRLGDMYVGLAQIDQFFG